MIQKKATTFRGSSLRQSRGLSWRYSQDEDEYTGVETFMHEMIEKSDPGFFPIQRSALLEATRHARGTTERSASAGESGVQGGQSGVEGGGTGGGKEFEKVAVSLRSHTKQLAEILGRLSLGGIGEDADASKVPVLRGALENAEGLWDELDTDGSGMPSLLVHTRSLGYCCSNDRSSADHAHF